MRAHLITGLLIGFVLKVCFVAKQIQQIFLLAEKVWLMEEKASIPRFFPKFWPSHLSEGSYNLNFFLIWSPLASYSMWQEMKIVLKSKGLQLKGYGSPCADKSHEAFFIEN